MSSNQKGYPDEFRAARGIVYAIALGAIIWVGIAAFVYWIIL